MGERERGKPDPPATQPAPLTNTASLFSPPLSRSASTTHQPQMRDSRSVTHLAATTSSDVVNLASTNKPTTTTPQGWTGPLRQVLWEKWRWGVLIAFAVIVSRLSSSP